jgi:hypothetical protein
MELFNRPITIKNASNRNVENNTLGMFIFKVITFLHETLGWKPLF